MPKYLFHASYTSAGAKGLRQGGGGSQRRAAVKELLQKAGGRLEALYFAFGQADVFTVAALPDRAPSAARQTITSRPPGS